MTGFQHAASQTSCTLFWRRNRRWTVDNRGESVGRHWSGSRTQPKSPERRPSCVQWNGSATDWAVHALHTWFGSLPKVLPVNSCSLSNGRVISEFLQYHRLLSEVRWARDVTTVSSYCALCIRMLLCIPRCEILSHFYSSCLLLLNPECTVQTSGK